MLQKLRVARGDGSQLGGSEVLILQHPLVGLNIDLRDITHHQDALLDLVGIANQVIDLLQGFVVLLGVIVELLNLFEARQRVLDGLARRGNLFDRIGNIASKVHGITHHPLSMGSLREKAPS